MPVSFFNRCPTNYTNFHELLFAPGVYLPEGHYFSQLPSFLSSQLPSFRRRRLFARRALFFPASQLLSFPASLFSASQLPSFRRRRLSARRASSHYSIIPPFHHSNCERSELSSNLYFVICNFFSTSQLLNFPLSPKIPCLFDHFRGGIEMFPGIGGIALVLAKPARLQVIVHQVELHAAGFGNFPGLV